MKKNLLILSAALALVACGGNVPKKDGCCRNAGDDRCSA